MTATISKLFDDQPAALLGNLRPRECRVQRSASSRAMRTTGTSLGDYRGNRTTTGVDRDADGVDDRAEAAGAGAGVGAAIGGTAGLLAGLGLVAIPGVGPVVAAGWLVATAAGALTGAAGGGLIGALTQAGVSEEDAHVYAEGVRRGGTLVTARVPDNDRARLQAILDRSGVDIARRREAYRENGWDRFDEKSQPYTADQVRRERQLYGNDREGVIPMVEEELRVGKREVDQGGVKVKSHVVETPYRGGQPTAGTSERGETSRELSAVGERARFSRSHHRGGAKGSGGSGFEGSPSQREVVVNKDVQHRNQKVSDTVRRTEVEVDDERTKRGAPATPRR